jgi:hypothetical protein
MSRVGQRGSVMSCRGRETRAAANFFFEDASHQTGLGLGRCNVSREGCTCALLGRGSGRNCWEGARDTSLFANGGARFIAAARGGDC